VQEKSEQRKPANTFFLLRKNPFLVSGRRGREHPALTFSPLTKEVPGIISVRAWRWANQSRRLANACNVAQGMIRREWCAGYCARNSAGMVAPYIPYESPHFVALIRPGGDSREVKGRAWISLSPYDFQFAGTSNPAIYITPW